jgi:hypothetical protein
VFGGSGGEAAYMYLFSALFHGTTHPKWVQTAFRAKSARFFCSSKIKYVASPLRPCTSSRAPAWCESFQPATVTSLPRASLAISPPPAPPPVRGTKKDRYGTANPRVDTPTAPTRIAFMVDLLGMSGTNAVSPLAMLIYCLQKEQAKQHVGRLVVLCKVSRHFR